MASGSLYALADEWLAATEGQSARPASSSTYPTTTNAPPPPRSSSNNSASFLSSYELPTPTTSTASSSPSKQPTLFLLDDCLSNMNNARQTHIELRTKRRTALAKKKKLLEASASANQSPKNYRKPATTTATSSTLSAGGGANAAKALSAAQKLEAMQAEAAALEHERLVRRAAYAEAPPNLAREAAENNRRDKENLMNAVENKLRRDKEAADRAKFEPPAEFVHKMAKKAEDEARHAAFGKGKDGREAMTLGKAAYASVKDKYRKQVLGEDQLEQEEEREEAEANAKRAALSNVQKVPMFSTGEATRSRLGVEDSKADFAATKAWRDFEGEVHKWDLTGGRNEIHDVRDAFAEYLTEKYMCQVLDGLASTIVVTKVRKDIVNIIEQFVAGEKDGEQQTLLSSEEEDDSDSDGAEFHASASKNVRLRELMEKKLARKQTIDGMRHPTEELPLQDALQKQEELKTRTLRYKNDEKRVKFEQEKEENRFRKDLKKSKLKGAEKTFKSFEPWKCGLCGKTNECKIQNCVTCGRCKTHKSEKELKLAEEKKAREVVGGGEDAKAEAKKKADEAQKINNDYLQFLAMKTKTDTEAVDRDSLAGDINGLLASLRGTLGPLSDEVVAPPVVIGTDWRVHEPNGRKDGQHVGEVNHDTSIEVDVVRKNKREDFLHSVGAGGEFAPKEGVNKTYHLSEAEKNYHEIKRPFDYSRSKEIKGDIDI